MIKKLLGGMALIALLAGTANAATVSLIGPASVGEGETFTVDMIGDFTGTGLQGGAVEILYDPTLVELVGFEFIAPADPTLSCPGAALCPDDPPGSLLLIFSNFSLPLISAADGVGTIGQLTLRALGSGDRGPSDVINLDMIDAGDIGGGWFGEGLVDLGAPPDLFGASIAVETTVIPLPAAAWLMIGGLGALMGFRRR